MSRIIAMPDDPQSDHSQPLSDRPTPVYTPPMRSQALKLLALLLLLPITAAANAQDWAQDPPRRLPATTNTSPSKAAVRTVQAFVVYPEVKDKAPVVILIHEIFGLSDWAKEMADELSRARLHRRRSRPAHRLRPQRRRLRRLPRAGRDHQSRLRPQPRYVNADLDAAADYAKHLPAANGKIAVTGFCWGGGKSFAFAAHRHDLSAAFVFYGPGPSDVTTITAPVYGFYAGNDARIGATIPATTAAMKAAGKNYEPVTYDGAGHGFMRAGEDPTNTVPGNKTAREEAFTRMVTLIKRNEETATRATNASSGKTVGQKSITRPSCHAKTTAESHPQKPRRWLQ